MSWWKSKREQSPPTEADMRQKAMDYLRDRPYSGQVYCGRCGVPLKRASMTEIPTRYDVLTGARIGAEPEVEVMTCERMDPPDVWRDLRQYPAEWLLRREVQSWWHDFWWIPKEGQ